MLRLSVIVGYAVLMFGAILTMAVKAVARVHNGFLGGKAIELEIWGSKLGWLGWVGIFILFLFLWLSLIFYQYQRASSLDKGWVKSLGIGVGLMSLLFLCIVIFLIISFQLEGVHGEIAEKFVGLFVSPVLLELTLFSLGGLTLSAYLFFKMKHESLDEFVSLEELNKRGK